MALAINCIKTGKILKDQTLLKMNHFNLFIPFLMDLLGDPRSELSDPVGGFGASDILSDFLAGSEFCLGDIFLRLFLLPFISGTVRESIAPLSLVVSIGNDSLESTQLFS